MTTTNHSKSVLTPDPTGPNEEKTGNLLPARNISSDPFSGIYVDRGVQTDMTAESFPFQTALTYVPGLSPNALRTQQLVDRYFYNIEETKHILFKTPSLPILPDDVWTDILANRFVEIERIHLAYNTNLHHPHDAPNINTSWQWIGAFESYCTGVCIAFPHRKEEFETWFTTMKTLFAQYPKSHHHTIVRAERRQRRVVFDSHSRSSLNDGQVLVDLEASCAISFAPPTRLPVPPPPALLATRMSIGSIAKRARTNGACRKWNNGYCTFDGICKWLHVCAGCRSESHRIKECLVKKKTASST